jgi:putative oxidoreductase
MLPAAMRARERQAGARNKNEDRIARTNVHSPFNQEEASMIDNKSAPYGALLLRVSMGVLFILHGLYLKALVFGMAGAGKYFVSLGLPGWFAWVVMLYETIGGLALILGVCTRWVAVFLGVHLLFAAYLGHAANGWTFTSKGGGYEYPVFWAIACFTLALLGSGANALMPGARKA